MASSGSYNYTTPRDQIINLAGLGSGVLGIGRVASAEDTNTANRLLNLIVKQWMGESDFAPGLKIWTRKRAYLFPQTNQSIYSIGTGGDHATASYSQTTLSAAEAAAQTVLSVTSTTGMTAADNIGIRLSNNSIHWTTIVSTGAGPTVTITTQLPSGAASGATVYWYTSKIMLPLEMISVRRMTTDSQETPLTRMSLMKYEEGLLVKNNDGYPTCYLYERGITTGSLKLDFEPTDTTEIYRLTFLRPAEDFDAATDTPDYPQEWERPLVGQLAIDWATFGGRLVTQEMKDYRDQALAMAGNVDPENQEVFFQSES